MSRTAPDPPVRVAVAAKRSTIAMVHRVRSRPPLQNSCTSENGLDDDHRHGVRSSGGSVSDTNSRISAMLSTQSAAEM